MTAQHVPALSLSAFFESVASNAPLAERLAAGWIRTGDYLFEAMSIEADFVIGNPPYVRLEDIPEETAYSLPRCLSHDAREG